MPDDPKDLARPLETRIAEEDSPEPGEGRGPYTWGEVPDFDNCCIPAEQQILAEVMQEKGRPVCPHLKILDTLFHYCSKGIPDNVAPAFDPYNPIMVARQGALEVQLYCRGEFRNCVYYAGTMGLPWLSLISDAPLKGEKVTDQIEEQAPLLKKR